MKNSKLPSQRQLRVGEQIRHAIVQILQHGHFRDPDLTETNLITVTEVKASPDLKNATAFVIPLGGQGVETLIPALNRAASFIRGEIGQKLDLRFTPRISFEFDHSFDYAHKIDSLLKDTRVARDITETEEQEEALAG